MDIKKEKIVDIDSEILAPAVSSYEKEDKNYSLFFWSKDKTATEGDKDTKGFDLAKDSDISPIDLYSIYPEKNIRTVTFKSQDEIYKTVKVVDGEKISKLSNPSRESAYFSYWYKDDYKTQYDFDAPVTSDITLNAKWNVKIYSISSLMNGNMKLDNSSAQKIKAEDCSEITAIYKKNGESDAKPLPLTFDEAHSGENGYSYFKFEPLSPEDSGTYIITVTNGNDTKSKELVISCASAKKTEVQEVTETESSILKVPLNGGHFQSGISHSFLKEKDEGCELTVTGLFTYGKPCILTENPSWRNKVTFVLEVSEELDTQCKEVDGKTVTISGILTDAKSTWSKKMTVTAILR